MGFSTIAVAGGLLLGLLAGGRPSNIGRRRLRWWAPLVVGVVLQAAAELFDVDGDAGLGMVLASYACLVLFGLANLRLVGMSVVLAGLAANAAVIVANSGMPVRADAITAAGVATPEEVAGLDFGAKRHLERPGDRFVLLGDVIPVRPTREVLSFGDLVLAAGVADVLFRLLRPVRARRRSAAVVLGEGDGVVIDLRQQEPSVGAGRRLVS